MLEKIIKYKLFIIIALVIVTVILIFYFFNNNQVVNKSSLSDPVIKIDNTLQVNIIKDREREKARKITCDWKYALDCCNKGKTVEKISEDGKYKIIFTCLGQIVPKATNTSSYKLKNNKVLILENDDYLNPLLFDPETENITKVQNEIKIEDEIVLGKTKKIPKYKNIINKLSDSNGKIYLIFDTRDNIFSWLYEPSIKSSGEKVSMIKSKGFTNIYIHREYYGKPITKISLIDYLKSPEEVHTFNLEEPKIQTDDIKLENKPISKVDIVNILNDEHFYLAGGCLVEGTGCFANCKYCINTIRLFNAKDNTIKTIGKLPDDFGDRFKCSELKTLKDNKILINDLSSNYLYDCKDDECKLVFRFDKKSQSKRRKYLKNIELEDSKVLTFGNFKTFDIFNTQTKKVSSVDNPLVFLNMPDVHYLNKGKVFVSGGYKKDNSYCMCNDGYRSSCGSLDGSCSWIKEYEPNLNAYLISIDKIK